MASLNPIPTEGGPFGPEQLKTVWHFHSFMAGVTKIYDFVYLVICCILRNAILLSQDLLKFQSLKFQIF